MIMARWINIVAPFNYEHSRTSVTFYSATGEFLVPENVADFAVANGFAIDGKTPGSRARSIKSGPKRVQRRRKPANPKANAAADNRSDHKLAGASVPATDSTGVRSAVDSAAEQR
jgi:hypothetical protein